MSDFCCHEDHHKATRQDPEEWACSKERPASDCEETCPDRYSRDDYMEDEADAAYNRKREGW